MLLDVTIFESMYNICILHNLLLLQSPESTIIVTVDKVIMFWSIIILMIVNSLQGRRRLCLGYTWVIRGYVLGPLSYIVQVLLRL